MLPNAEVTVECNQEIFRLPTFNLLSVQVPIALAWESNFCSASTGELTGLKALILATSYRMYGYLRDLGVKNISLDLIYEYAEPNDRGTGGGSLQILELNPKRVSLIILFTKRGHPYARQRSYPRVTRRSVEMMQLKVRQMLQQSDTSIMKSQFIEAHRKPVPCIIALTGKGLPYIGLGPGHIAIDIHGSLSNIMILHGIIAIDLMVYSLQYAHLSKQRRS